MRKLTHRLTAVICALLFLCCSFPVSALAETSSLQAGTVIRCTSYVNVRSGPGTWYVKKGAAPLNATYAVLGKSGSWVKVQYGGTTGYIHSAYLAVADASSLPMGTVARCKYNVNVRSGPGTQYGRIGTAPLHAGFNVLDKVGAWYKVQYQSTQGFIHGDYLSVSAELSAAKTGNVVRCENVNVRSGPGTSYGAVGTAAVNSSFAVLGKSGSWYKILFHGKTGYIYSTYLSVPGEVSEPQEQQQDKIVAGYYASWAAYSGYSPLDMPAGKLTHINYAFADIGPDLKIAIGDPAIDEANFQELRQLKQQYPHIKTLISVGGWTWSGRFSDAALTQASRAAFADSVVTFIKKHGFDGVDIDWEYPVGGGMASNRTRPEDKQNFTLLMAELRAKLDEQGQKDGRRYLLSFAGGAGTGYTGHVELDKLGQLADFATIMTYDMHGAWAGSYTDFNAPLYTPGETSPQYQWSCDAAVKLWIGEGFPAGRILMGIPFYGVRFTGAANANRGLYQRFSSGGSVSYDKIAAQYLSLPSYTRYVHSDALVPWLFDGSTFISYDDGQSISKKAAYIASEGLGGAAIWELSQNADGTLVKTIYDQFH